MKDKVPKDIEIVPILDISNGTAKKIILDYLKYNKPDNLCLSEIVEDLAMDLCQVIKVVEELKRDGIIKENNTIKEIDKTE